MWQVLQSALSGQEEQTALWDQTKLEWSGLWVILFRPHQNWAWGDSSGDVKLREAVPNTVSVWAIHQRSDGRQDRVTVPQKHLWMIYAAQQSADNPLCLQSEEAIWDLGCMRESRFTAWITYRAVFILVHHNGAYIPYIQCPCVCHSHTWGCTSNTQVLRQVCFC